MPPKGRKSQKKLKAPKLDKCPCNKDCDSLYLNCSNCDQWWHSDCLGLGKHKEECEILSIYAQSDTVFNCPYCIINSITLQAPLKPQICKTKEVKVTVEAKPKPTPNKRSKDTTEEVNLGRNIIIVDNIKNPGLFKDSITIKKEINKFKPSVKITHCYQLCRGGIAIHLADPDQRSLLLSSWPEDAFGGSGLDLDIHDNTPSPRCILRNVNHKVTSENVSAIIQEQTGLSV
ncbi:unnamed protein product, partial [Owenia fusiformis]